MEGSFQLDLFPFATRIRQREAAIWCLVRKKWISVSPEELVRQAMLHYLVDEGYPLGRIGLEKQVGLQKTRLDLLVYDALGQPWMLIELKAASHKLSEGIPQLSDYVRSLRCPYCLVANGVEALGFFLNQELGRVQLLSAVPDYPKVV